MYLDNIFFNLNSSARNKVLNVCGFIGGCLYIAPIIKFYLFGMGISPKVDSSSLELFMFRSVLNLYESFWDVYINVPPAVDSLGVCSILQPELVIFVVRKVFVLSLFSGMQILSKFSFKRSRNVLKLPVWGRRENIFRGYTWYYYVVSPRIMV